MNFYGKPIQAHREAHKYAAARSVELGRDMYLCRLAGGDGMVFAVFDTPGADVVATYIKGERIDGYPDPTRER